MRQVIELPKTKRAIVRVFKTSWAVLKLLLRKAWLCVVAFFAPVSYVLHHCGCLKPMKAAWARCNERVAKAAYRAKVILLHWLHHFHGRAGQSPHAPAAR